MIPEHISSGIFGSIRLRHEGAREMDDVDFYAAQLNAWPWLHLPEFEEVTA
ncbi:hypothetical protein AB0383_48415 [Amycolatopsis sp. NPDC051373]|uniref:hypothetical protein n=1 Tax=Amycolatopsis sp. NPDC051373 TaxID=3155801 RepID=UPI00344D8A64